MIGDVDRSRLGPFGEGQLLSGEAAPHLLIRGWSYLLQGPFLIKIAEFVVMNSRVAAAWVRCNITFIQDPSTVRVYTYLLHLAIKAFEKDHSRFIT